MQFIKTIQNFAFQYNLWEKGSKIIIGVSGGPDSSCLLFIFSELAKKYDLELHIAHVNYGLRGAHSDKDEIFVRKLSENYNIPISVLVAEKSGYEGNLENNLRDIRYEFFEKLRLELGFNLIAVAHNQDDQAETVMMRIIRGSGLNGLSAMKPKNNNIIRPLLQKSKIEILAFLKARKLKFRIDKSNLDKSFARNNIRHRLLPYLEKHFNPSIKKTIAQWSISVADDYDFIAKNSERFTDSICKNKGANKRLLQSSKTTNLQTKKKSVNFNAEDFLVQHISIQRQVLRNIFSQLKTGTQDVENQHIEEILKVIGSSKNKTQKAHIGGLNILKKGDSIEIFC